MYKWYDIEVPRDIFVQVGGNIKPSHPNYAYIDPVCRVILYGMDDVGITYTADNFKEALSTLLWEECDTTKLPYIFAKCLVDGFENTKELSKETFALYRKALFHRQDETDITQMVISVAYDVLQQHTMEKGIVDSAFELVDCCHCPDLVTDMAGQFIAAIFIGVDTLRRIREEDFPKSLNMFPIMPIRFESKF